MKKIFSSILMICLLAGALFAENNREWRAIWSITWNQFSASASTETLKQLLINAASNTHIPDEKMTILLPEKILGLEDIRQNPNSLKGGALVEILSEVTRKLLKSEVIFSTGLKSKEGIVFSLRDGEIKIDLTDEALTALLLSHLQPRFRAILEGVVA